MASLAQSESLTPAVPWPAKAIQSLRYEPQRDDPGATGATCDIPRASQPRCQSSKHMSLSRQNVMSNPEPIRVHGASPFRASSPPCDAAHPAWGTAHRMTDIAKPIWDPQPPIGPVVSLFCGSPGGSIQPGRHRPAICRRNQPLKLVGDIRTTPGLLDITAAKLTSGHLLPDRRVEVEARAEFNGGGNSPCVAMDCSRTMAALRQFRVPRRPLRDKLTGERPAIRYRQAVGPDSRDGPQSG